MKMIRLETDRLILRRWQPSDHLPFSKLNADMDVMHYFPAPLSESDKLALKVHNFLMTMVGGFGL